MLAIVGIEEDALKADKPVLKVHRHDNRRAGNGRRLDRAKGAARNVRQDANKKIKDLKGSGVSEDDIKRLEKEIQQLTDKTCKEADDLSATKEKEIMTI